MCLEQMWSLGAVHEEMKEVKGSPASCRACLTQLPCLSPALLLTPASPPEVGPIRMNKLSGDLERSLPAVASLSSSLPPSQDLSSHFLLPPPEKHRAISDVRRTFCLFVTFDLLFISLLWIIELNVSGAEAGNTGGVGGTPTPSAIWGLPLQWG